MAVPLVARGMLLGPAELLGGRQRQKVPTAVWARVTADGADRTALLPTFPATDRSPSLNHDA
jgi:hypothetical protein